MNLSVSVIKDTISLIKNFLRETRTEGKKVVWPSRQYIIAASVIVILIVFISAVFVLFIDYVFAEIFAHLMRSK
jgi:preprotein translocase SecE subunit